MDFKVYYMQNSGYKEIRRFRILASNISGDYPIKSVYQLRMKLNNVFPELEGKLISLYWKDEENDLILIGNDEELKIAMDVSTGAVHKLYIKIQGEDERPNMPPHYSNINEVLCNECHSEITGFRFICTECPNYDLCDSCERKYLHDRHVMIRIGPNAAANVNPKFWAMLHGFRERMIKREGKRVDFQRSTEYHEKKGKAKHKSSSVEVSDSEDDRKRKDKKCRKSRPGRYGVVSLMDFLNSCDIFQNPVVSRVVNDGNAPADTETQAEACPTQSSIANTVASAVLSASGNDRKDHEGGHHTGKRRPPMEKVIDILANMNLAESDLKPVKKSGEAEKEAAPGECIIELDDILKATTFSSSRTKHLRKDSWDKKTDSQEKADCPKESDEKQSEQPLKDESEGATAMNNEESPEKEAEREVLLSSNPKIILALSQMMKMGFKNEDNWLLELLKMTDGDILKVLEFLESKNQ